MMIDHEMRKRLIVAVANRVIANADELTDLDRAIGDGDHGTNMRRGFEAVLAASDVATTRRPSGLTPMPSGSGPTFTSSTIAPLARSRQEMAL